MDNGTDEIPSVDWDLADIYYATSEDGFNWTEQGVAVPRAPKGQYGDRAATTTDILVHKGKFYLYFQTYTGPFSSKNGDQCDVSLAWADSPHGPGTRGTEPVIPLGANNEWDGGLAAICTVDGPEKNTVQYAEDGLSFKPMASISVPPITPGPYVPDAFLDNGDGKGITWVLSHVNQSIIDNNNYRRIVQINSFLIRFDCGLHRDYDLPYFRNPRDQAGRFSEETIFQPKMVLEDHAKKAAPELMKEIDAT
jgi:hypothetical protein